MTTEITARDKLLLYVVGMLAFIFFFVQFMLTPALEASDEAAASLAEAQQAQIAMQETIALAGTNAAAKTESWAALQQANANYYGLLSSSDLDTLVSNLELGHDLGPVSLDISAIDTQSLTGYAASTQADDTAAPTDINSADPMLATADTNTVLMELAPPLTRIYAQADYFKQCTVTFRCTGSDSNFYTMLDDLAAQYELTARETEIMGLIAQRKSRAEIEQELFLSQNTVKTHVRHLSAKLGARSKADVIALFEE